MATQARHLDGQYVHANGIDIHYVEAGQGQPLLLLDNALVSTNPIWASLPFAYARVLRDFSVLVSPPCRSERQT